MLTRSRKLLSLYALCGIVQNSSLVYGQAKSDLIRYRQKQDIVAGPGLVFKPTCEYNAALCGASKDVYRNILSGLFWPYDIYLYLISGSALLLNQQSANK